MNTRLPCPSPNSQSLLKLLSIESAMPSNHLILCCSLHFLPSIFPSIRVFSSESVLHIRWPKYWSFSISPSDEYSGLISFRIYCFDLLESKGLSRVFSETLVMIVSGKQQRDLVIHIHVSGEGNGKPLQYSCLENPMDGGVWCRLLFMG